MEHHILPAKGFNADLKGAKTVAVDYFSGQPTKKKGGEEKPVTGNSETALVPRQTKTRRKTTKTEKYKPTNFLEKDSSGGIRQQPEVVTDSDDDDDFADLPAHKVTARKRQRKREAAMVPLVTGGADGSTSSFQQMIANYNLLLPQQAPKTSQVDDMRAISETMSDSNQKVLNPVVDLFKLYMNTNAQTQSRETEQQVTQRTAVHSHTRL